MSSMSTARPWTLRDGSTPSSPTKAPPAARLLADRSGHLGEVQHRAASPGSSHDHRAVLDAEVLARDLAGLVPRAAEDLHRFDLERLFEGPTGHLLELAPLVRLHEVLDLLDRGLEDVRDLLLRLLRDVLVVDARREAADHDRADRHLRGSVDELPRGVRAVVPGQLVHDLALEGADRVLVDRAGRDDAVLDHDERVFLLQLLQADVAFRRDRGLERHAEVLRQDRGEQRFAGPELLPAFLDVRLRKVPHVDLGEDERDLLPGELALLVGQEERAGDVIVNAADDWAAEPRGEDAFLHPHEDAGLCARLFALQHMQVHLVAVEVRVVRRTYGQVESERLMGHDADLVRHHRHPVQRGLPVEQHEVALDELPLDRVADLDGLGDDFRVLLRHADPPAVWPDDVVHAGRIFSQGTKRRRTPLHPLLDNVQIVGLDVDGDGQLAGGLDRHADLVDRENRIRGNHRPGAEVHTLARQIRTESAFLAFQPLDDRLQWTSGPVPGGRNSRRLVVEVRRHVILKELPQILHDELGRTRVPILAETLVDPQDIDELVREVVLRAVSALQGDRRTNGHRRDEQRGQDHPLRSRDLRIHPQDTEVLVRDPLQALAHLFRRELVAVLPERRRLIEGDLALFLAAMGTPLALLRLAGGLLRDEADLRHVAAELLDLFHLRHVLLCLLAREEEAAALSARRLKELLDVLHVADVDHGHRKVDVPEVARAIVDLTAARLAPEAGLDDPEVGIHQAHVDRESIVVVGVGGDDLRRRHPPDLVGAQQGELDRLDSFRDPPHRRHHRMSSSCRRMTTPKDRSSSSRSLNAYEVCTG